MSCQHHASAAVPSGKNPPSITGWTLEPVGMSEQEKISCSCWDWNPGSSNPQLSRYPDYINKFTDKLSGLDVSTKLPATIIRVHIRRLLSNSINMYSI